MGQITSIIVAITALVTAISTAIGLILHARSTTAHTATPPPPAAKP